VLTASLAAGFTALPAILWRKQTNAPNKFMGSGMLPAGAYVTLEHEYILILRKGGKREFRLAAEKRERMRSAIFWEERNAWFSDVWTDLKGTGQALARGEARKRSAAFPEELAYRLIQMFSVRGDTVLDPFLGMGTTTVAALASGRNSIGVERDRRMLEAAIERVGGAAAREWGERRTRERLEAHEAFVRMREREKGPEGFKHRNSTHGWPVMTRQETGMVISRLIGVRRTSGDTMIGTYEEGPPAGND
jgi:DNA modification methylase